MKLLISSLICFLVFINPLLAQENLPPVGLQEMIDELSSITNPADANGKSFQLKKPESLENAELVLKPENAFKLDGLTDKVINVTVANSHLLFDMNLYNGTGIVKMNPINFNWKISGELASKDAGNGFQTCSISVGFKINNTIVTQKALDYFENNNYKVELDYDANNLEHNGVSENEFIFKRKNNSETSVALIVFKPDGSLFAKASVPNIAKCEQSVLNTNTSVQKWSDWSEWSKCSSSCSGTQSKVRYCLTENLGIPCIGNSSEERSCNIQSCPDEDPRKYIIANPSIVRVIKYYKLEYEIRYQNIHPTRRIVCNMVLYAKTEAYKPGEKREFTLDLKAQEVSDWYKGTLKVSKWYNVSSSISTNRICKFAD